jgi:hypothetical protein
MRRNAQWLHAKPDFILTVLMMDSGNPDFSDIVAEFQA